MVTEDTAATMRREDTITRVSDHVNNATIAQKFILDALHDLAGDNHDGLWTHAILNGLDLLRSIASSVQSDAASLWEYGKNDIPF